MLSALERSTIAERVAKYIVEHLLSEEPMIKSDLNPIARDVAEDIGGTMDADDLKAIIPLSVQYVIEDPRVARQETKSGQEVLLWFRG